MKPERINNDIVALKYEWNSEVIDPSAEFFIANDMFKLLYVKCKEYDENLETIERDHGKSEKFPFYDESLITSAAIQTVNMYESTERFLSITLGSLFERTLRSYFSVLEKYTKKCKLPERGLFEGVKQALVKIGVEKLFEDDLFTYWEVLVKIRNLYTHSFKYDPSQEKNLKELSKIVSKNGLVDLVLCNPGERTLHVTEEFYERCFTAFVDAITKFDLLLDKELAFESYVLDKDGELGAGFKGVSCLIPDNM